MKKFILDKLYNAGIEVKRLKGVHDNELYEELYAKDSIKNRRFYNISAGGHFDFGGRFYHPLWTNVDVDKKWTNGRNYDPSKDLLFDPLTLGNMPIDNSCAELAYSKLTVEHITDEAAQNLFKEIHRILKPGGIARFLCPHTDLYYRAYTHNDKHFFYWAKDHHFMVNASIEQLFIDHFAASCTILRPEGSPHRFQDEEFREIFKTKPYEEALDFIKSHCDLDFHLTNRRNHINWWNFNKFNRMLSMAGFKKIYLSLPGQSFAPAMRNEHYFDNLYNKILIYVEVIKD